MSEREGGSEWMREGGKEGVNRLVSDNAQQSISPHSISVVSDIFRKRIIGSDLQV